MAAAGGQVIDLEGLANHRGSLFGAMPGGQPSQKAFEGRLARVLARLDATRPVLVEAESSRVGEVTVPRQLWAAMCAAPRVRLDVPLAARADYTARSYAEALAEPGRLAATIGQLRRLYAAETIADWLALAEAGDTCGAGGSADGTPLRPPLCPPARPPRQTRRGQRSTCPALRPKTCPTSRGR